MATQVTESVLPGGCQAILKKAESWYTIAYRVGEGRLVLRGRRGEQQFMAVWRSGKADCAYWWQREHEAYAELPRELVRWTTPAPTPVKVGFRELGKLLQSEVELPHECDSTDSADMGPDPGRRDDMVVGLRSSAIEK